ncbi:MAG TPA: hypothetical protein DCS93_31850 [Microscillaceae bacterium]|nr:hypothetical protein [Microscillaceae bacterium]
MKAPHTYDILIVGFGPVGMLAANLFGKYGLKVAVFERNEKLYDLPRAIHIDDETMRILQYVGLHQQMLKVCKPVPGMQLVNRQGKVLLETSKAATAGYEASYLFFQPDLEEILIKGIERFVNVEVFWGAEVTQVKTQEKQATVYIQQGQKTLSYEGKYVLACDGANSTVRTLLNLPLKDLKFTRQNLKTDVLLKEPVELPNWIQKTCEPNRQSHVFLNSFENHVRWEFSLPKRTPHDKTYWENPDTVRQLLSLVIDPDKVVPRHVVVYRFATKIAQQWQQGAVFLAGDAAHQMPPYIGQGMCAGFRDVLNLGWKLKLVLQHEVSPQILQSYPQERMPHVRFVMFVTCWVGRLFITRWTLLIKTLARIAPQKWRKVQVPPKKLKKGLFGKSRRLRGHLFPQFRVSSHQKTCLIDDCLGDGFNIIGFSHHPQDYLTEQEVRLLEDLGFQFSTIFEVAPNQDQDSSLIQDLDNQYKRWFRKHRVDFVIIRPDRYIYDAVPLTSLSKTIQQLQQQFSKT